MFYLIALLVLGISFIPFALPMLYIWEAQGLFTLFCCFLIFGYSFFENTLFKNKPLGMLIIYLVVHTAVCGFFAIRPNAGFMYFTRYTLFGLVSFMALVFMYQGIQTLYEKQISDILNWMKFVVTMTLFMCVLQILGLSQFFKLLPMWEGHAHINNLAVGFMGNGTHLSGFFGFTAPLFLIKPKRQDILTLVLLFVCLFFTSTKMNDPAITGFVVMGAALVFFYKKKKWVVGLTVIVLLVAVILALSGQHQFFALNGRQIMVAQGLQIWKGYWLTGRGIGVMNFLSRHTMDKIIPHSHLEYLQFGIEIGIFGLILIANLINDLLHKKAKTRTELALKASLVGFLVSCCFNYSAHLWLFTTWAMFFYGAYIRSNSCLVQEN